VPPSWTRFTVRLKKVPLLKENGVALVAVSQRVQCAVNLSSEVKKLSLKLLVGQSCPDERK